MGKKDYVPVGGIMTRKNGKKYQVNDVNPSCEECAFVGKSESFCGGIPCVPIMREDDKHVNFIRRKDLEEPKQAPADSQ